MLSNSNNIAVRRIQCRCPDRYSSDTLASCTSHILSLGLRKIRSRIHTLCCLGGTRTLARIEYTPQCCNPNSLPLLHKRNRPHLIRTFRPHIGNNQLPKQSYWQYHKLHKLPLRYKSDNQQNRSHKYHYRPDNTEGCIDIVLQPM